MFFAAISTDIGQFTIPLDLIFHLIILVFTTIFMIKLMESKKPEAMDELLSFLEWLL